MYVRVKVITAAKKEEIKKKKDAYIICVKEKAERNLANRRICLIIAKLYNVSVKNVRIVGGHQNTSKILSINLPENLL